MPMPDLTGIFGNGALTGAIGGAQAGMGLQQMELANIASSINNQKDQYAFDELKKDADLTEAERKYKAAKYGADTEDITSGSYKNRKSAADDSQVLSNENVSLSNKEKKMLHLGDQASQIKGVLDQYGQGSVPPHVMDFAKQRWKDAGFQDHIGNDQEFMDKVSDYDVWNQNESSKLKAKAANQNKLDVAKQQGENAANVANIRGSWQADIQDGKDTAKSLMGQGKMSSDQLYAALTAQAAQPGGLNRDQQKALMSLIADRAMKAQMSPNAKIQSVQGQGGPDPVQAAQAAAQQLIAGGQETPASGPQIAPQDAQAMAGYSPVIQSKLMALVAKNPGVPLTAIIAKLKAEGKLK